ncbi:predicted protein [Naegleria gruberi]|uniref:Predicted protein n=1 Tax=Naegleria gruberi TaxID=5762 RepID=D2W206_NAEGR|nr:uncharacterized protein NAEGRDRAFT_75415 [Naegleria gruberi]EFC36855.1 predicted protein [Naegleria gruberi]|eukprot:XP_002669599.1 predicted protein [Naegleria gruberi strain NEG-M]
MNRYDFLSSLPFLQPFHAFNQFYEEFSRKEPYSSKYDNVRVVELSKFLQQHYEQYVEDAFMIFSGNSCLTDDRDELHFFFKTGGSEQEQLNIQESSDPGQLKTKIILIKAHSLNSAEAAERYLFGECILKYDVPPSEKKRKKLESTKPTTFKATTEIEIEHAKALELRGFLTYNTSTKLYELVTIYFVIMMIDGFCFLYDHTEIEKITKPILSINKTEVTNSVQSSPSAKTASAADAELLRDVELFLKNKDKEKGLNTSESEIHNEDINIPYLGLTSCYTNMRLYHILDTFEVSNAGDKISTKEEKLEGIHSDLVGCMNMMLKHLRPINMGFLINLIFGNYLKDSMTDEGDSNSFQSCVYSKWNNLENFLHSTKTHPILLSSSNLKTSSLKNIPTQDLEICYNSLSDLIDQYQSALMPISSTANEQALKKLKQKESDHKLKIEEMCKQFNNDSSLTNSAMLVDLDEEIANMRATQEMLILSNCVLNKNFSL